jgi:ParB/RepB/Spo0J family partition protein
MIIPLSSIEVLPDRQRADYGDIPSLAASIKRLGQLQPVVVTRTPTGWRLLAGGRRMRAVQHLGRTEILATELADLPKDEQELIELEENVRRKDLEWPEYIEAIARFASLTERSQREIAEDLQIHPSSLSHMLTLAPALVSEPRLREASSWKSAYDLLASRQKKQQESIMEDVMASIEDIVIEGDTPTASKPEPKPVQTFAFQQSFIEWAPSYSGRRFNLIHCDFPYGLNMDTANLQGSADRWNITDGRYDDSPELFDALVRTFFDNQDRFIADSAHCIFWLAHKHVGKIASRFRHYNWIACEVPLIWHKSDNAGIAPDVRRQPRRTYEIAIFATRGDRPINRVKAASFSSPTTKEHHLSEKPLAVVTHFLEMVTDEYTELLDPTCGSGTSLEAALRLGASRAVGLDVLEQHVAHTNKRCTAVRNSTDSDLADLI